MSEIFGGDIIGRRLDSAHPEGQLARLEIEHEATPQRVERARRFFPEAKFADFEALGSLGRRWRHRESGEEFLIDEAQVLDSGDPTSCGVKFVVHGPRIFFLRALDHDPVHSRVIHGEVIAGRLGRGPDGRDVVVPTKQTGTYDDRPWVGVAS